MKKPNLSKINILSSLSPHYLNTSRDENIRMIGPVVKGIYIGVRNVKSHSHR